MLDFSGGFLVSLRKKTDPNAPKRGETSKLRSPPAESTSTRHEILDLAFGPVAEGIGSCDGEKSPSCMCGLDRFLVAWS